jgi:hypothetical protein
MSQVTRTTNDLIVSSLYLLGELGVGESPDAMMLSTGLEIINEIIDGFSADSIYISYLTTLDFNFVVGQQTYSISDLIPADINADRVVDLTFATYSVESDPNQPITYPLYVVSKAEYYNVVRLQKLQARPGLIFLNKQATESFITVYPAPDQPYKCSIQVKSMINSLSANEDLTSLPPYYYGFLKYALAREFRSYYPSGNWNDTAEQKYQDYIQNLKSGNEVDLTIRPSAILTVPSPYFWWQTILAY